MTHDSYEKILAEKRIWYKSVKQCYCPILKENIIFNSRGFHHLLFDGLGHARTQKERIYRVGLLPLVIPVLKNCTKIDKYTPPTYSKSLNKNVEYWLLKENVGKRKTLISVVLRKIGTGNITFYSIWKKKDRATKKPSK